METVMWLSIILAKKYLNLSLRQVPEQTLLSIKRGMFNAWEINWIKLVPVRVGAIIISSSELFIDSICFAVASTSKL